MNEYRSRHYGESIDEAVDQQIEEAPANNHIHGRINKSWAEITMPTAYLLFFGVENGNPVATHTAPTIQQTILLAGTYFPASPGTWHDIITFTMGQDLLDAEFEFIPENLFTAKFWIRSDMLRNGVLFRLTAINTATGESLATGTASVNLWQTGELQPVIITGLYEKPAVVRSEDIRMRLQIQTPEFGVQFGIFSIPPNEISYISRLISGATIAAPEPKKYPIVYRANLSAAGNQVIIPLALDDNSADQIYLRYKYSTTTEISISVKSAYTSNLVDIKRATQYGPIGVEGSTIDNTLIDSTYQTIDSIVYNESQEMHRIWIRFKDYLDNNIWSAYEICCFCSANAKRTDIWVNPVYQGYIGAW